MCTSLIKSGFLLLCFFFNLQHHDPYASDQLHPKFSPPPHVSLTNATIKSNILSLTNSSPIQIGRALYPNKIPTQNTSSSSILPFSTFFIFAMEPTRNVLPGHSFVFLFTPITRILNPNAAQNLGFSAERLMGIQAIMCLVLSLMCFETKSFEILMIIMLEFI